MRTAQRRGERTPLACRFRRLAKNFVPLTFLCGEESQNGDTPVWAGRPNRHAGRVRSPFPFRNSGSIISPRVPKNRFGRLG